MSAFLILIPFYLCNFLHNISLPHGAILCRILLSLACYCYRFVLLLSSGLLITPLNDFNKFYSIFVPVNNFQFLPVSCISYFIHHCLICTPLCMLATNTHFTEHQSLDLDVENTNNRYLPSLNCFLFVESYRVSLPRLVCKTIILYMCNSGTLRGNWKINSKQMLKG